MELDKVIQIRKSVRKFKDKKPDWRDIITAIDSVRYVPTAGGHFVMKFILVDDKDKINRIAEACQQDFIKQTYYLVVALSEPSRLVNSFDKKGEIYTRQQAGAAIQNFLLKTEEKNLSTCWIGHFVEEQIRETLGIKPGINVEAVFPVGFEFKKTKPRRKIEMDRILYFNSYGNKKMKKLKK